MSHKGLVQESGLMSHKGKIFISTQLKLSLVQFGAFLYVGESFDSKWIPTCQGHLFPTHQPSNVTFKGGWINLGVRIVAHLHTIHSQQKIDIGRCDSYLGIDSSLDLSIGVFPPPPSRDPFPMFRWSFDIPLHFCSLPAYGASVD